MHRTEAFGFEFGISRLDLHEEGGGVGGILRDCSRVITSQVGPFLLGVRE